jgi:hypothetical protein
MGRRAWSDRRTVEECKVLNIASLVTAGVFGHRGLGDFEGFPRPLSWRNGFEATARYQLNWNGGERLRIAYTIHGQRIEDQIGITSTASPLGYGRRRYFFRCPGIDGFVCGRRVGKLYLPPGENLFRCRACWDLTYEACKNHDKRLDAFRRLPARDLALALESADPLTRWLALKAATHLLDG